MKRLRDLLERLRLWNLRNQYEDELNSLRYWEGPLNQERAAWLVIELAKLGRARRSQSMATPRGGAR